ncbi:MAG: GMC family oxidoreductase [Gammaproteobacteria bacterium]|nr:GMC family oxidoreductase [Gammaproteobacteria bacterium]
MVDYAQKAGSEDSFDVVIVGSGAAGSVIAAQAARAGKRTLLLEAGPARQLSDLASSQLWARKLKWAGAPVGEEGNLRIGHVFNAGWGSGGSALHHYAVWPRLHENDFKVKSQYGRGMDWPLEYRDLRPYYDRIQAEVGLSGDARAEKWRPPGDDYPMAPLPVFAQGRVIGKGFAALGMATAPIPLAVNSTPYKGRKACLYDGWCDAGCPIGALANPLVTYLAWALEAGAELRNNATVTRVLHDSSGRKATGVEYCDAAGNRHRVNAGTVVLAAFAVQNARLLLASASDRYPRGLANSNDLVGRFLMTHPAHYIYGLFAEETQPHLGPTGGQLISHDRYPDKAKGQAYGSYQWIIATAAKPNDLLGMANTRPDIYGPALDPFMRRAAKHFGNMVFVGEDLPLEENRITLGAAKDEYGVPLAKTVHNVTAPTDALCEQALAEGKAVFKAAGADEPWNGPRFGMHIFGGTVMGADPKTSVTDAFGRCHELDNLYVAGPGVFPGSGAVNPTFTIHALALRTAERLLG